MSKPIDQETRTRIAVAYKAGQSSTDIAKELSISKSTVSVIVASQGGAIRTPAEGIRLRVQQGRVKGMVTPSIDQLAVRNLYDEGLCPRLIADRIGCSASTIRRIVEPSGATRRSRADAKTPKSPPDEATKSSWFEKRARTKERRQTNVSPYERALMEGLIGLGLTVAPQKAVKSYNIDLAIGPVAVEVFGGGIERLSGDNLAREDRRLRCILNEGWHYLAVLISRYDPLSEDYVAAIAGHVRRLSDDVNPAKRYLVIRRGGEVIASGRSDDPEVSLGMAEGKIFDRRLRRFKLIR